MKRTLNLKYNNLHYVKLPDIAFFDARLPHSQCLPDDQVLRKYDIDSECFPVAREENRIDKIFGAPDM